MKFKANLSSNIFKKIIYKFLISLILLSNYSCNSTTFKRDENNSGGSRWVFWTYKANGERQCAYLCILVLIILSILYIIICISYIWYWIFRSKTSIIHARGFKSPLKIPQIHIDYAEGDSNITHIDEQYEEAEKFTREYPPQEELPPPDHIDYIQSVGGARAWQWIAEEWMLADQTIAISNEGEIIKFLKNMNVSIQTNYPCFVPGINAQEGDQVNFSEEMFEEPQSISHRQGQMLHYYEITILENSDTNISIGLATKPYPYFRLPGLNLYSVGYHSINGYKYNDNNIATSYGPDWTEGDTVGCGYNPTVGHVFFTKNGEFLEIAFTDIRHIWFPTIGASGPCVIEINFGNDPNSFLYKDARGYGPGGPILLSNQRGSSKNRT
ncbi:896_t:CDS:1 [Funneliformis geosporum]|uniref:4724_t:CDS:1 n=1 Tax=Funneliformis geosporum TaxID=1117311 RepID=A0A9W4SCN5_9GLOM|nr:4724_t:CDS:1 [Funneliformis geosporum]CAI2180353.1 896_t:CDS:1 [Funneliformis geosporum]